jgi:hypothetical protein
MRRHKHPSSAACSPVCSCDGVGRQSDSLVRYKMYGCFSRFSYLICSTLPCKSHHTFKNSCCVLAAAIAQHTQMLCQACLHSACLITCQGVPAVDSGSIPNTTAAKLDLLSSSS